MFYPTTSIQLAEQDLRFLDTRDEARLQRGLVRDASPPRWLTRQRCLLLCQAGRLLIALGERLKQAAAAQAMPVAGQASSR